MKYILLIYGDEKTWQSMSEDEIRQAYAEHGRYGEAMIAAGVMRGGAELEPVTRAMSIHFSNGTRRTVHGPFAETKEQLGGYYLIETDTLEEAIEWAEKVPMTEGTVEIRPLGEAGGPD